MDNQVQTPEADPRRRNVTLDWSSVANYKRDYAAALSAAIGGIADDAVETLCRKVQEAAAAGRHIFAVGNGGSAAIAEHLCCDWTKGTNAEGHPTIPSRSLTANSSVFSAIANDYGYERVFDTQLGFFGKAGDVLIAISSSGNSPNILNAVSKAKEIGMFVAGLSGFSGGRLAEEADCSVHVSVENYGLIEDAHQAVMHIVAQFIACERDFGATDARS